MLFLNQKQKEFNNYIYNSIVNYAIYKYNTGDNKTKIQTEDILHEIILQKDIGYTSKANKMRKKKSLHNYYKKKSKNLVFLNKYEVEQAFSNLKYEMDKSAEEFYKTLEKENEYSNDDYEL